MVLIPGQDTIMLRGLRLRAIVTHGPVKAALQPTGEQFVHPEIAVWQPYNGSFLPWLFGLIIQTIILQHLTTSSQAWVRSARGWDSVEVVMKPRLIKQVTMASAQPTFSTDQALRPVLFFCVETPIWTSCFRLPPAILNTCSSQTVKGSLR